MEESAGRYGAELSSKLTEESPDEDWQHDIESAFISKVNGSNAEKRHRTAKNQIDLQQLRSWLDTCEEDHHLYCASPKQNSLPAWEAHNLYLIDVHHSRIITSQKKPRYLALSYVWGGVPQLLLTRDNWTVLAERGSLLALASRIPQVIKDAMLLVHRIGERYLWVDSLCIMQDDANVKHDQIAAMNTIYATAVLTIIMASGEDANYGLPGLRPNTRTLISPPSPYQPSTLSTYVSRSHYNTRAWTLQERILSQRCLYFTAREVIFQCNTTIFAETPLKEDDFSAAVSPADLISQELCALNPLSNQGFWYYLYDGNFSLYADLVCEFTNKSLSYPSDIANAFNGIEKAMSKFEYYEFVDCLPVVTLDLALLWNPETTISRRCVSPPNGDTSLFYFPSWSWTGWIGKTHYEDLLKTVMGLFRIKGLRNVIPREFQTCIDKIEINGRGSRWRCLEREGIAPSGVSSRRCYLVEALAANNDCVDPATSTDQHQMHTSVLRFRTALVSLDNLPVGENIGLVNNDQRKHKPTTRRILTIYDSRGISCGGLYLSNFETLHQSSEQSNLAYVLLSKLRQTPSDNDSNPMHRINDHYYPPEMEWCTFNVMLVEKTGQYYERRGIGQIHSNAWEKAPKRTELIQLI